MGAIRRRFAAKQRPPPQAEAAIDALEARIAEQGGKLTG